MKIQKFLNTMAEKVQYHPEIHLPTFKLILNSFYSFLSNKQKERWKLTIQILTSFTTVQQTLHQSLNSIKTNELEKQLNKLKNKNDN